MILTDIHKIQNPYAGFPLSLFPYRPFLAWGSEDPNFTELIHKLRPKLIIEVGVWYGGSTIHMSDLCVTRNMGTTIVSIDTFLGAEEMWDDPSDSTRFGALMMDHGRPSFYNQFLANVMHTGHQDHVIPWAQTSLIAARKLAKLNVQADMIYIDGSHHHDDVLADLKAYYPLVKPGGVIFGDDFFTFMEVGIAVKEFADSLGLKFDVKERQWEIWKPV